MNHSLWDVQVSGASCCGSSLQEKIKSQVNMAQKFKSTEVVD